MNRKVNEEDGNKKREGEEARQLTANNVFLIMYTPLHKLPLGYV